MQVHFLFLLSGLYLSLETCALALSLSADMGIVAQTLRRSESFAAVSAGIFQTLSQTLISAGITFQHSVAALSCST